MFRPEFVKATVDRFHYLHFGLFSFLLSGLVGAIVSLATDPIKEEKLHRLTFWTRFVVNKSPIKCCNLVSNIPSWSQVQY